MLTYIMQFNMTICYIRGSSNTIPDSLSRLFQDSSPLERRENESKYMHEVDDFILPVTTRFQNRASLELDRQTMDTARTEHAPQLQLSPREPTVRDDAKFPHAVHLARGSRKMPLAISGMDSSCNAHQSQAATRDDSKLADAAQLSRDGTKMPLDAAIMDPPGQIQQTRNTPHAPPALAVDAEAQAQHSQFLTIHCMRMTRRYRTRPRMIIILIC